MGFRLGREAKRAYGSVLARFKAGNRPPGFTPGEVDLGDEMKHFGLAELVDADPPDSDPDRRRYSLLAVGKQLVRSHTEARLMAGRYALPDEVPWYDGWPWKYAFPGLVALAVSLAVSLLHGALNGPPRELLTVGRVG